MNVKPKNYKHVYIEHGKKIVEKTEAQKMLLFLYTSFWGRLFRVCLPARMLSKLYGCYQRSSFSRRKIKSFIAKHKIAMDDFVEPQGGYASFDDFFCRTLAPGARSIDEHLKTIISPADAKCWTIPELTKETTFFVKHQEFSLSLLLRDEALARYFQGGSLVLLRLAPYDYHRYHAPFTGDYAKPRRLAGKLESVNPLAFKAGIMPLIENERHIILARPTVSTTKIAVIPVGALCVGKIAYTAGLPGPLSKGEELGYFGFGASSIILLAPKGAWRLRNDLVSYTRRGFEVSVKMGESLGSFV